MTESEKRRQRVDIKVPRLLLPERYFAAAHGLGRKTLSTVGDILKLPIDGVHISHRIQAEMPANQAKIGAQYVHIASKLKNVVHKAREQIENGQVAKGVNVEEWLAKLALDKRDAAAMNVVGHGTIVNAMLAAEDHPIVPDKIIVKTVNIARRVDTQPELLLPHGWISEVEAVRAEQLMIDVPDRLV